MTNQEITKTINNQISVLKAEVNSLPSGGSFESLKANLNKIQLVIKSLVNTINDVENTLKGGNK